MDSHGADVARIHGLDVTLSARGPGPDHLVAKLFRLPLLRPDGAKLPDGRRRSSLFSVVVLGEVPPC